MNYRNGSALPEGKSLPPEGGEENLNVCSFFFFASNYKNARYALSHPSCSCSGSVMHTQKNHAECACSKDMAKTLA